MANYTIKTPVEKSDGTWYVDVIYDLPDVEGCVDRTTIRLAANSEQELDREVMDLVILINDNK